MAYTRLKSFDLSKYNQKTIRARIEAFFLDNLNKIITNEQLIQVAKDPKTGIEPENWHQRLSELRTDYGYTILSQRDHVGLKNGEYVMPNADKRETAKERKAINKKIRDELLEKNPVCSFPGCNLKQGDIDPIGGGKVNLQVDHKTAHDHDDLGTGHIDNYQLLCGRHNVTKKNFWDDQTGKVNTIAILQSIKESEKRKALKWLTEYFKEHK